MNTVSPIRLLQVSLGAVICALSAFALLEYPGHAYIYLLFTLICNALLYAGFRKKALFFDAFIGAFFWLGFWLKLTLRVAFIDGTFHEDVGNFDGSGTAFDRALLVTCCGLLPLLLVSILRERFGFSYPASLGATKHRGLLSYYQNNRAKILIGFSVAVVLVTVTNFYFGIYQRGELPRTIPPFGLRGVYTWLLLFGLATFSALILDFEFSLNKKTPYLVVALTLLEGFLTNVSMLSRGMILNSSALAYGVVRSLTPKSIRPSYRLLAGWLVMFVLLFAVSIVLVQHVRSKSGESIRSKLDISEIDPVSIGRGAPILFVDRWVGMEGVLAVTSYPKLGWGLWNEAWREVYAPRLSFYDANLVTSPYRNTDMTKHHNISLPGIVAFCFYPGSYAFLFLCRFVLGWIAVAIEIAVFK
ncbi:MAG: hypothetical protein Q7T25_00890, partial [Sideroxyarcus sp.]|nr:hypothetical protein [Sideroxyarcus sp.]